MHDLTPITALGESAPRRDTIAGAIITEVPDIALASVAARRAQEAKCAELLAEFLGAAAPSPGRATLGLGFSCIWTGPDQWMVSGAHGEHEDIASRLKDHMSGAASITEQSDGWAAFDLSGEKTIDMLERLCPLPARRMQRGDATRTTIDHLGCFVLCLEKGQTFRVLGPRSAAASLHHALCTAARAVS